MSSGEKIEAQKGGSRAECVKQGPRWKLPQAFHYFRTVALNFGSRIATLREKCTQAPFTLIVFIFLLKP